MHTNRYRFASHLLLWLGLVLAVQSAVSQTAPVVEPVYGGRIHAFTAMASSATTTRVVIATESANSLFYTDVDHAASTPFTSFEPIPEFDQDDGYGGSIQQLASDAASGLLFLIHQHRLLAYDFSSGDTTVIATEGVSDLHVYDGMLFYLRFDGTQTNLHFGAIGSSFAEDAGSPVLVTAGMSPGRPRLQVSPGNDRVYVFAEGEPPVLYQSSDAYTALDASTTFATLPATTTDLGAYRYGTFGIGPDGRVFLGSVKNREPQHSKFIAYTDDDGVSWDTLDTGIGGAAGANFAFAGSAAPYHVYFGTAMSASSGEAGSWDVLGHSGFETHPNDGGVLVDPNDPQRIYMTTDQGIGSSTDRGATLFEINEGVQAVQVNGFSMSTDKSAAWLASKSGVRRVTNYMTASEHWELFFPNGDGSPYYAAAMDTSDATANTAFVGNARVYWTTDGGTTWQQIFSEMDAGFDVFASISAIVIDPYHPTGRIFVSYFDPGETKAGLFAGEYDGSSWSFTPIAGAPIPTDGVDIHDLAVTRENGTTVVYAGVEYYMGSSGTTRSVYRIEDNGSGGWTISQDMANATQNISATIHDLHLASDRLYACGTDANATGANVYYKGADSTAWTPISGNGLPGTTHCRALAVDESTGDLYIAVEEDLYALPAGASSWLHYYTYPVGTRINFLYFDDLLVGTGTGLYMHPNEHILANEPAPGTEIPDAFRLAPVYPNPFNPAATLRFHVHAAMPVRLRVYDMLGREVARLFDATALPGRTYTVPFQATGFPSGIYLIRMETPHGMQTRSAILLK